MSTFDRPWDPCVEQGIRRLAVARASGTHDIVTDAPDLDQPPSTPARDRVIRFVQHPAFRRPAPTRLRAD